MIIRLALKLTILVPLAFNHKSDCFASFDVGCDNEIISPSSAKGMLRGVYK